MPLTEHDAEERSRQLIGRVLDARETVSDTRDTALDGPEQAKAHLTALRELTDRQDDLIAELREQVRLALEPYSKTPAELAAHYAARIEEGN